MTRAAFSVIVPTYEREAALANCLQALAALDYPRGNLEVIVADDGSRHPPGALLDSFRERLDVRLLTQPHAGPAAARNAAAAQACFEYLAFTDDDCAPARDWLKAMASVAAARPGQAIGGPTVNALVGNAYATASGFISDLMLASHNPEPERAKFLPTCNLAVPADRFRAVGGFDACNFPHAAGEDRDFCERWVTRGFGMVYAPEVLVYHANHLDLRGYCRQHLTRGRAAFHYHRKRGWVTLFDGHDAGSSRAPTLSTAPARIWHLMLLWRAAHAAGFVWQGGRWAVRRTAKQRR